MNTTFSDGTFGVAGPSVLNSLSQLICDVFVLEHVFGKQLQTF